MNKIDSQELNISIDEIENLFFNESENQNNDTNDANSIPKEISGILTYFTMQDYWRLINILDKNKNRKDTNWIGKYQAINIVNDEKKRSPGSKKKRYAIDKDLEKLKQASVYFFDEN